MAGWLYMVVQIISLLESRKRTSFSIWRGFLCFSSPILLVKDSQCYKADTIGKFDGSVFVSQYCRLTRRSFWQGPVLHITVQRDKAAKISEAVLGVGLSDSSSLLPGTPTAASWKHKAQLLSLEKKFLWFSGNLQNHRKQHISGLLPEKTLWLNR